MAVITRTKLNKLINIEVNKLLATEKYEVDYLTSPYSHRVTTEVLIQLIDKDSGIRHAVVLEEIESEENLYDWWHQSSVTEVKLVLREMKRSSEFEVELAHLYLLNTWNWGVYHRYDPQLYVETLDELLVIMAKSEARRAIREDSSLHKEVKVIPSLVHDLMMKTHGYKTKPYEHIQVFKGHYGYMVLDTTKKARSIMVEFPRVGK